MEIYKKLMQIQQELKVPKNNFNSFGKYKYRSCEDILENVKPIAAKFGCIVLLSDQVLNIGSANYINSCAMLIDIETGDKIEVFANAKEEENKKGMDSSQISGSASSYSRKIALNGLFAIDDTKDSDSTNTHGKENYIPANATSIPANVNQKPWLNKFKGDKKTLTDTYKKIVKRINDNSCTMQDILDNFKVSKELKNELELLIKL